MHLYKINYNIVVKLFISERNLIDHCKSKTHIKAVACAKTICAN